MLTWQNGRRLASITDGNQTSVYTYNAEGIRTSKTVGEETTRYIVNGSRILCEVRPDGTKVYFYYDEGGSLLSMEYGDTMYYYVKNLQGDIVQLIDETGNVIAGYQYDTWGKVTGLTGEDGEEVGPEEAHIGNINSFRYRGYYYDAETGFYYVSSRYYDPVNMTDPDGNWPQFVKNAVKWVTKNVVQPVTKAVKKALSKVNKTYSTGINVSGTPSIFCFNAQGGISVDTKGNVAVQGSFSGGVTGGTPSASITVYQSRTNAPNINKLEGLGYQLGGSAGIPVGGVPLAGGADFNIIPDSATGKHYYGTTTSFGVGIPGAELHVEWGNTATWNTTQFNIFDSMDQFCINIMEW